ncbi:malonyl-CoA O-methyltransferase [Bathymodiolus platifrons methanotrophic gill symbiont]|uniref:malonyl-ACP O-methyltransferase BioC n=1 Tax=Bathymodiolus platifrons methanotrophic gill symbiont TaxID=113268 RepID=UPI000B414015|nr:malonyl-ACP O-methyltransferase BioC [Bathymodiolus platifrons methanotrophic gill symbiont]MCK5869210.1 malonyl-ACP O-methyltransferase BioC [Methyloprofundus sp.]TXK96638.1 malonyl-[acyl-carrier protein] O-methyltransferase BioC [Methylococcaceae bacterium CS4]TXK99845.1 malonyl-[acyl-carrier protein] O-methyltransferase BioC [Methylococcaceae bacterium CS5]TXL01524.1 malonyl-[acyl-carrier protein] O-methyltransferase BioC [Methylococcaceae bacterium HT1]TXL06470.1 malonyl-[acyl-carrier p
METNVALDKRQIRQSFANAAQSYDAMATLQRKVGHELIAKLAMPHEAMVVDVGCGTGFFTQQLRDRALLENILALDVAMPMLLKARQRLDDISIPLVCADAEQLPFASHSIDGLVSNLALQWCQGLGEMFADVFRVLRANGSFVFSTFGESALCELKAAWAAVDDYPHVNDFCNLSLIKQHLQAAGFVDVQLESRVYQIKYNDVIELMRELKGIGAHNVSQARNKTLTTKGQLQVLVAAYPKDDDGKITASYEIIYVQAKVGGDI